MNSHSCIKCRETYKTEDDDAYYCEACIEEKNRIAEQIDKKMASRPSNRKAPSFEEQMQSHKQIKGITMINLPR